MPETSIEIPTGTTLEDMKVRKKIIRDFMLLGMLLEK